MHATQLHFSLSTLCANGYGTVFDFTEVFLSATANN